MKLISRLTRAASLFLSIGLPYHEALGEGVNVEFFMTACMAAAVDIYALEQYKR